MSEATDTPGGEPERPASEAFHRLGQQIRGSVLLRFLTVGVLAVVMQVPLALVEDVVLERGGRHAEVKSEIARQWGREQLLRGPVLVVPFREKLVTRRKALDSLGRWREVDEADYRERTAVALPETLDLDVGLTTETRQRGLFEVLVYGAEIAMAARFAKPEIARLSKEEVEVDWSKAFIAVGLSDPHAIKSVTPPSWQGRLRPVAPNTGIAGLLEDGFRIPLDAWDAASGSARFNLGFAVNGSGGFRFAPVGESTKVVMHADWPHPSFQGATLPVSHEIGADGFEAEWQIPSLARSYPQLWLQSGGTGQRLDEVMAGVDLAEPVVLYTKLTRATKYGILYVALTFLTFLMFELTIGARLHLVQYGLIGLALSLFYLTLLSLAEHVAFASAYLAASGVIVALVTLYAWAALRRLARAALAGLALAGLYGVLYTLLQMEDFSLLAGTGLLLVVLALLMLLTRNLGAGGRAGAAAASPA